MALTTRTDAHAVKASDRITGVGMTGSGKSYFFRHLIYDLPRLIVLDVKNEIDNDEWRLQDYTERGFRNLLRGKPARLRVWQPFTEEDWETYLEKIYNLRNVTVYIDELYNVGPATGSAALRRLYTQGRSKGIAVYAATQRPVWVPRFAFSEVNWIAQFRLQIDEDRDVLYRNGVGEDALRDLRDHQLVLTHMDTGESWYYPDGVRVVKKT